MAARSEVSWARRPRCCVTCAASDSRRRSSSARRSRQLRSAKTASCAARSATRTRSRAPRELHLGLVLGVTGGLALRHLVVKLHLRIGKLPGEGVALRPPRAFLHGEIGELRADLHAPRLGRFRRLLQLQQFEIEIVAPPLLRGERQALVVVAALRRVELAFDGGQRVAGGERLARAPCRSPARARRARAAGRGRRADRCPPRRNGSTAT